MQAAAQHHRAIAYPGQPAYRQTLRFPQPPHFAIASLAQYDVIPVIGALTADIANFVEARQPDVELHALLQGAQRLPAHLAEHTHRIFTLDLCRGVHQAVGQFAIIGQQQQALGIQIQATDRYPAPAMQGRQALKYRRPALGIAAGSHLTDRLVISQHAPARPQRPHQHWPAIELDALGARDLDTELSNDAIDSDAPLANPRLDLAPGTDAGTGQEFLQAFSHQRHPWAVKSPGSTRRGVPEQH